MDEAQQWWGRLQRTAMVLTALTTASAVAGGTVWVVTTLWLAKTALYDLGGYMVELGLIVGGRGCVGAAVVALLVLVPPSTASFLGYLLAALVLTEVGVALRLSILRRSCQRSLTQRTGGRLPGSRSPSAPEPRSPRRRAG